MDDDDSEQVQVRAQNTKKSKKKSAAKKKLAKKKAETNLTQLKTRDGDDTQDTQTESTEDAAPVPAPKPKSAPKPVAKKAAPKKVLDPLDVVEPDPVFKTKEEKIAHDDKVRNEGLKLMMFKPKGSAAQQETDLEIEEPGAANSVAEEGAKVLPEQDFASLSKQLKEARAKKENKLGEGGFEIAFVEPKEFENTMRVVVMTDPKISESQIKAEKFDTKDQAQT